MYSKVWKSCHAAVCQISFLNERGVGIDALTGFKVENFLVTSSQAFWIEKAHKVEITFVDIDANTVTASMRIPYAEFTTEHRIGSANNKGHYAVFNINLPEFQDIPSLKLSEKFNFVIGSPVASLAFSFGCSNLSLRTGIVSSSYKNADGARFIQYDGQVCYGNSGAPLIDPNTLEVIGIISRRNTPAAKAYSQLIDIITTNLNELRKVEASVKFGHIDPIQVLIANQNQLKHLANNMYKFSSDSSSQAVTLDRILSFFNADIVIENDSIHHQDEVDAFQV